MTVWMAVSDTMGVDCELQVPNDVDTEILDCKLRIKGLEVVR